jgi:hypothetical protein
MSASRYYRVSPTYWHLASGWDDRTTNIGIYVQTCSHRHSEGLYYLPKEYIAADRGYTIPSVTKSLKVIADAGLVKYDAQTNVLLLMNALELQAPNTPLQIKGAIDRIRSVPRSPLLWDLYWLARSHSNGLADSMAMEFPFLLESQNGSHSNPLTRSRASTAEGQA